MAWSDVGNKKDNIILVFIDDMGWADLSCYGNRDAQTPNIYRMAAKRIAFEQYAEAYKFIDEQGDNIMKVMIDL